MAIERLSPEDRLMLWRDDAWPQESGVLVTLDGGRLLDADGRLRLEAVRAAVESRLHLMPRLRQLLYRPGRGQGGPLWIDAPRFDIREHVMVDAIPGPGGERELLAKVEQLRRPRLDRSRPLWGMWFLTGVPHGRVVLFAKLHHVAADGVAGLATLARFLDLEPDANRGTAPDWSPSPPPTASELRADELRRRGRSARSGLATLRHPLRTWRGVEAAWPAMRELLAESPPPPTSLAGLVGGERSLVRISAPLDLLRQIGHSRGATVNDVFLDLLASGLRGLFDSRQELAAVDQVRVFVPVSLRGGGAASMGNEVGQMVVPLPVGVPDWPGRLDRIAAETRLRKSRPRPNLGVLFRGGLLGKLIGRTVPLVLTRQGINVETANVPGPAQPLYFLGAHVRDVYPVLPLIGNVTLGVGAFSYAGRFNVLAVADRAVCPDLAPFREGIEAELRRYRSSVSRPGVRLRAS